MAIEQFRNTEEKPKVKVKRKPVGGNKHGQRVGRKR
jgi:hypothetical protein